MLKNCLAILQLCEPVRAEQLERAYCSSRTRYELLTAKGPLSFYRRDLLLDMERAYEKLKKSHYELVNAVNKKTGNEKNTSNKTSTQSLTAQRAKVLGVTSALKLPVTSSIKQESILPGKSISLDARKTNYWRGNENAERKTSEQNITDRKIKNSERQQSLIEDDYCREVIYRLEGDIIRYDNRKQLLYIADKLQIHPFRANMLMAQIVEAVRQNRLYLAWPKEHKTKSVRPVKRWAQAMIIALAVVAAVIIDILLI